MRVVALAGVAIAVLLAAYLIARGPQPSAAQATARHGADSLTRVRLAAFGHGDRWGRLLRADALVVPIEPAGVLGREAAVADMDESFGQAPGEGMAVARVLAGATRRGRLAWAAAEMGGPSHSAEEERRPHPLRHSVAYLLQDGEWRVMLEHDARTLTWAELRAGAASGRFTAPPPPGASSGRGADALARRFKRWLPHLGRTRVERGAIAAGPTPEPIAAGDSAVKVMLADWERRLGSPRLASDGLRVWAPRNRGVGSVVANLEVSPPDWGGVTLPLRFTGVYRESGDDTWNLVLAHLSAGVPASPAAVTRAVR